MLTPKSVSVANTKPKPERKIISQSQVYHSLSKLADPDAFDFTELMLDEDTYSVSQRDPVSFGDILDGLTQLATTGAVEVTEIVAAIHCEIMLRPLGRFDTSHVDNWRQGLTGQIYNTVERIMQLVGNNLGAILQLYGNHTRQKTTKPLPEPLKMLVNALNGVMGDHLVSMDNPLATPMMFYDKDGVPQHKELSGYIVILLHGLSMSYLSWHLGQEDGLGEDISKAIPDATVLYLDYNTGKRISINGHCLANMLQALVDKNPDISQIDLIGHSMGGLVARSSLFYGEQNGLAWTNRTRHLITLGSPHHGAVLERIGSHAQDVLSKVPFAGSLAKLGDLRSAGIIDLRHGSIRDDDWKNLGGRDVLPEHFRHPATLPLHVNTYLGAGSLQHGFNTSKAAHLLGDGLVSVESALGEHAGDHTLYVPDGHKAVFYGVSHMDMQYNVKVRQQVVAWLQDTGEEALKPRVHHYVDDSIADLDVENSREDSPIAEDDNNNNSVNNDIKLDSVDI